MNGQNDYHVTKQPDMVDVLLALYYVTLKVDAGQMTYWDGEALKQRILDEAGLSRKGDCDGNEREENAHLRAQFQWATQG